jgi:DNA gyrase subunit B
MVIKMPFLKKRKWSESDDFREGLSAVISVKVPEPQFEGQTKTKLMQQRSCGIVQTTVPVLWKPTWKKIRRKPEYCQQSYIGSQARVAARKARELVQRKTF